MPGPIVPFEDLIGNKFERLTVLEILPDKCKFGRTQVLVRCECGVEKPLPASRLGVTKSCGCFRTEMLSKRKLRHGHCRDEIGASGEYRAWQGMKSRCTESSRPDFPRYGGRGITVCERWLNSFDNFLADMGLKPSPKHSIDRYPNNNGNYEPGNCRWATDKQQCRNRRSNLPITYNGKTQLLIEWSEELGIRYKALHKRIVNFGWTPERAFTTPLRSERGRQKTKS